MTVCKVPDCCESVYVKGYCHMHYNRFWRYGDPNIVKRRQNGSGTIHHTGYVIKRNGNSKQSLEHRLVVEKALGRPLKWPENVHHMDGNKVNNHPSNLVVCPNMAYHRMIEKRMKG